jgi:TetR/AcrR family transcriptional regulator
MSVALQAPTRSERRKARTAGAILDAAERHFLQHGFEATKVDEIADEADVAVGSVYNHFTSKEGLYGALLERTLDLFDVYMDEEPRPDGSALEQLLDIAGRLARFGRERPGHLRLLLEAQPPSERLTKTLADQERRTAALIEAAVRRGDARPLDSRRAAAFLWSAWGGVLTLGRQRDDRELRAVLEAGLRIVIGGVASDEGRRRDTAVRALLESAPAPASTGEPPRQALRRAPVLGTLRSELPELAVWTVEVAAKPSAKSPTVVRRRLKQLASATGTARESSPWAYRVLLRQLGLDPADAQSATERLALRPDDHDQIATAGLPEDALVVATIETGVPLLAFDAAKLHGELALRRARPGEVLEGGVVIADERAPVAALFGETVAAVTPTAKTERIALAAVQAKGVPDLSVQEALWTAIEIMSEGS